MECSISFNGRFLYIIFLWNSLGGTKYQKCLCYTIVTTKDFIKHAFCLRGGGGGVVVRTCKWNVLTAEK